jgi:hypothetical protein
LDYTGFFLEFKNACQGWCLTDWKQVLHKHFLEPVNLTMVPLATGA